MASFRSFVEDFNNNKVGQVSGLSLEFLLFFLFSINKRVCVEVDRGVVENVSVLLQNNIGGDVGCFLKPRNLLAGFENFYNTISNLSIQSLSSGGNMRLCFIEAGLDKTPFIPIKTSSGFKVNRSCSFEGLLKNLELLDFRPVVLGPPKSGEYYINGGVVDVALFNKEGLYRISFLDECCLVYLVDLKTNNIIKPVDCLLLFPVANKGFIAPCDFFQSEWGRFSYKKDVLLNKKRGSFLKKNMGAQVVDYQSFIKKYSGFKTHLLPFSSERGFVLNSNVYIPSWFNKNKKTPKKDGFKVLDGQESLVVGSVYVHEDFGLCQFLGLEVNGGQERACLRFLDGVVKIDIHFLSKLSFFSHDSACKLNHLNRPGVWKKRKERANKEAQEYVGHIISSYSEREGVFSPPFNTKDPIIKDFVHSFKHKDTQDQFLCWEDVLKDLGNNRPMNRLVCGDVGFGKTEIALRASFVSVVNNQQVVVLAPTTILANQLFHSFVSRLDSFGVSVDILSSFSLKKEVVIEKFIEKKTDVLVGTSSLLFNPMVLKQCGLFIVDEEHRFGVKDKELVLSLNPTVNFLSLSATPIPRSLQLSLNSVRSLSTIQTPPIERKPIISFVHSFDISLVCRAILKEIDRGGQVFIVDNSVENLKKLGKKINQKLPMVSLGVVYSKLKKQTLVKTMESFVFGKTQVLLSTSIIESGIDIGLANTIIINNAQLFGLSQLYQLRGRVGRSPVQAFAWFLIPQKKQTPLGEKRLKTIIKNSALGAGYYIALSDLDIRGAGSLFGYKQSGDGGVGFELYTKLIEAAMKKDLPQDCQVDIYNNPLVLAVGDEGQRGYFYKCVFAAQTKKELQQIKKDFIKIFGCCPEAFLCLLKNREIGILAAKKRIIKIFKKRGATTVVFSKTQKKGFVGDVLLYINSFFNEKNVAFKFLKSENNLTFQYNCLGENDYILLLSFLKKIPF